MEDELHRLRDQARTLPLLPHNILTPYSASPPYSKTVYESAIKTLKSCDIRSAAIRKRCDQATVAAFVHSKFRGSVWYITSITIQLNSFEFSSLSSSCTCVSSAFCEHRVSLLLFLSLLQSFPEHRPKWCQPTRVLPISTASVHFFYHYGSHFGGILERRTAPFLAKMSVTPPDDAHPIIHFQQKPSKRKGERRAQWFSQSWNVAKKHLDAVLGEQEDSGDEVERGSEEGEEVIEEVDDVVQECLANGCSDTVSDEEVKDDASRSKPIQDDEVEVILQVRSPSRKRNFRIYDDIASGTILPPREKKRPKHLDE